MALKIRLTKVGSVHQPLYRVVVAEARSRRDGAAVENLGTYRPGDKGSPININMERVEYWLSKGALPTNTMHAMIKKARSEGFGSIEDPEWNIAAGILYNRDLWQVWADNPDEQERLRFMFGSYNAGPGTIRRATRVAKTRQLNDKTWRSAEEVAPAVQRWRYKETLPYVKKIEGNYRTLDEANRSKLIKKK